MHTRRAVEINTRDSKLHSVFITLLVLILQYYIKNHLKMKVCPVALSAVHASHGCLLNTFCTEI